MGASKVGLFTMPAGTGNQQITGVGFEGNVLLLWTVHRTDAQAGAWGPDVVSCYGFTDGTNQACNAASSDDDADPTICNGSYREDAVLYLIDPQNEDEEAKATFVSFDANGFTLNWTTAPATQTRVMYMVFRATNVAVLHYNCPTATGAQNLTGAGFTPNLAGALMGAAGPAAPAENKNTIAPDGWGAIGWTDGVSNYSIFGGDDDSRTSVFAERRLENDEWLSFLQAPSVEDAEANITSFNSDGCAVNWGQAGAGDDAIEYSVMFLDVPNAYVGLVVGSASTGNQDNTSINFRPDGVMFYHCDAAGAGTDAVDLEIGLSFWDGATQVVGNVTSDNGSAAGEHDRIFHNNRFIYTNEQTPAIVGEATGLGFYDEGWVINWSTAPGLRFLPYMAFEAAEVPATNVKVGTFLLQGSTGDQVIDGVGFKPTALLLWTTHDPATVPPAFTIDIISCYGFSDGTNDACFAEGADDGDATTSCRASYREDAILFLIDPQAEDTEAAATVKSFDADGFTLNLTVAPANADRVVVYMAINADNAYVGYYNASTSTGAQNLTGAGFTPTVAGYLAGIAGAAAPAENKNTISSDGWGSIGWATGASEQWVFGGTDEDASGDVDADSIVETTEFIQLLLVLTTTSIDAEANLTSFNSDGCAVAWGNAATSGDIVEYAVLFMELPNAYVGFLTDGAAVGTQAVTDPGFEPHALLGVSPGTTLVGSVLVDLKVGLGFADTHVQRLGIISSDDAAASGAHDTWWSSSFFGGATTSLPFISYNGDLVSLDATGFTVFWENAPASYDHYYLAFQANDATAVLDDDVADGGVAGDSSAGLLQFDEDVADGGVAGDAADAQVIWSGQGVDGGTVGDQAQGGLEYEGPVSDGGVVGDVSEATIDVSVEVGACLFLDRFTDVAGTAIAAHTADKPAGTAWVAFGGSFEIDSSNRVWNSGIGGDGGSLDIDIGADVEIRFLVTRVDTTVKAFEVWARGFLTGYNVEFFGTTWALRDFTTDLDTWTETIANGASREVSFRLLGSALSVWIDGVPRLSATDLTHTAGTIGIRTDGQAAGGPWAFDDFCVNPLPFLRGRAGDTATTQYHVPVDTSDGGTAGDTAEALLLRSVEVADGAIPGDTSLVAYIAVGIAPAGAIPGDASSGIMTLDTDVSDGGVGGDTADVTKTLDTDVSDGGVGGDAATSVLIAVRAGVGALLVSGESVITTFPFHSAFCTLSLSGAAVVTRISAHAGTTSLVLSGSSVVTQVSIQTGTASLVLSASSLVTEAAIQTGTASLVLSGASVFAYHRPGAATLSFEANALVIAVPHQGLALLRLSGAATVLVVSQELGSAVLALGATAAVARTRVIVATATLVLTAVGEVPTVTAEQRFGSLRLRPAALVTPRISPDEAPDGFYGGVFQGRPGAEAAAEDTATIFARGFWIVDTAQRAGATLYYVVGAQAGVVQSINQDVQMDLPGQFFRIPSGTPVTKTVVKHWVDHRGNTVGPSSPKHWW